jgi:hypothetical protein
MDAMDASFQAQTVATHALQNTGKALPQLCTVELCNLLGFQHPMAWLSHFIFMEVLFGLWESRCDLRSAKHVLGLPSCFHGFFWKDFQSMGLSKDSETPKKTSVSILFPSSNRSIWWVPEFSLV